MTPRQLAFVENKLFGMSNRAAVIAAGYSPAGAKQMGTYLMRHRTIRSALERGGFNFKEARHFVAKAFQKKSEIWPAVHQSMPKHFYDCPVEFLEDALNCKQLPLEVRAEFAAVLLRYQQGKR